MAAGASDLEAFGPVESVSLQARLVDSEALHDEVSRLRVACADSDKSLRQAEEALRQLSVSAAELRECRLPRAQRHAESLQGLLEADVSTNASDERREASLLSGLDTSAVASSDVVAELGEIDKRRQRAEYLAIRVADAHREASRLRAAVATHAERMAPLEADASHKRMIHASLQGELADAQRKLSAFRSAEATAAVASLVPCVELREPAASWPDLQGRLHVSFVFAVGHRAWSLSSATCAARLALHAPGARAVLEVEGLDSHVVIARNVASKVLSPPELPQIAPIEVLREVLGQAGAIRVAPAVAEVVRGPSGIRKRYEADVPAGLRAKLRGYQIEGFRWLASNHANGFGSLLADDMGLGKTVQTICLLCHLKEQCCLDGAALVVAPTSLLGNWRREFARFAPSMEVREYVGSGRSWPFAADVVLTSYGVVRVALSDAGAGGRRFGRIGALVLDEAQRVKNHGAAVSKACKSLAAVCRGARVALTGTPVENRLEELHSIFEVVLPGYLGSLSDFRSTFSSGRRGRGRGGAAGRGLGRCGEADAVSELRKLVDPFMLRRTKTDPAICPELPPKVDMRHDVDLTQTQEQLYRRVHEHFTNSIAAATTPQARGTQIFAMIHALRRVCNHPATYDAEAIGTSSPATEDEGVCDAVAVASSRAAATADASGKTKAFLALLQDILHRGEKCLVFAQYLNTIELLRSLLSRDLGVSSVAFTGALNVPQREATVNKFQNDVTCRVCFATLGAGGVGLNLIAASHVIHFDRCFNPAVEDQGSDRAHRLGQRSTVIVHRMISRGTFEERIDAIMKEKQRLRELCGAGGTATWLADYSDRELRDLFALGPPAADPSGPGTRETFCRQPSARTFGMPSRSLLIEPVATTAVETASLESCSLSLSKSPERIAPTSPEPRNTGSTQPCSPYKQLAPLKPAGPGLLERLVARGASGPLLQRAAKPLRSGHAAKDGVREQLVPEVADTSSCGAPAASLASAPSPPRMQRVPEVFDASSSGAPVPCLAGADSSPSVFIVDSSEEETCSRWPVQSTSPISASRAPQSAAMDTSLVQFAKRRRLRPPPRIGGS